MLKQKQIERLLDVAIERQRGFASKGETDMAVKWGYVQDTLRIVLEIETEDGRIDMLKTALGMNSPDARRN